MTARPGSVLMWRWNRRAKQMARCRTTDALIAQFGQPFDRRGSKEASIWHYPLRMHADRRFEIQVTVIHGEPTRAFVAGESLEASDNPPPAGAESSPALMMRDASSSPLGKKALSDDALRPMRVLVIITFPLMLLGCWAVYGLAVSSIAKPFLDATGFFAIAVLLGGAVAMVWVALRFTCLVVCQLAPAQCPDCGGRARLRQLRSGGVANYMISRCTQCGQIFENFLAWKSPKRE